eukprot:1527-Heterococcus_DN1.PRE.4
MFHPSNESAVPSAKAGGTSVHKKAFDNSAATTDSVITKVPTLEVCTQATTSTTSSASTITKDVTGDDANADDNDYDYELGGDADVSYNSADDTTQSLPVRGKAHTSHCRMAGIAAAAPAAAAIGATEREQKMLLKQSLLVMMTASGSTDSNPEPLVWRECTVTKYNRAGMGAKRIEGCEKMLWVITAVADTSIEYAIDLRKKYHDGINSSAAVQFGSWMHLKPAVL